MFKHLDEKNMSYFSHYIRALQFAVWSFKMYFVCIIHAVFPNIFCDTFSYEILRLAKQLEEEDAKH